MRAALMAGKVLLAFGFLMAIDLDLTFVVAAIHGSGR